MPDSGFRTFGTSHGNVFSQKNYREMNRAESMRAVRGTAAEVDALKASQAPRVPWDEFLRDWKWAQGEHVALVGPTGSGKTSLLTRILVKRRYVAVTATKPKDPTMDYLISRGYDRYDSWPNGVSPQSSPKRVIWPNARDINSDELQKRVFKDVYGKAYREGGWALVIDEGYVMGKHLGLSREMIQVWTQGRSIGVSHVVATQRPRWVPLEMYDQSTHLFFWLNRDERSLETLGDINRTSSSLVRELVSTLEQFQVLYINRISGRMARTTPPPPAFDTD